MEAPTKLPLADFVHRRAGHTLVAFEERLYLWGGYMERYDENYAFGSMQFYHSSCDVWTYQPLTDTWTRHHTCGDIPPKLCGCCATVHGEHMYVFGGFYECSKYSMTENENGNSNMLWRLNLRTFRWKLLNPNGDLPFPVDKSTCWTYQNRIYIFGGFGPSFSAFDPRKYSVSFVRCETNNSSFRGWIGQLAYYDIELNEWVWPQIQGNMPFARAAHAAIVSGDDAYIFGGRHKSVRLNDLQRLHLPTHTWSSINDNDDDNDNEKSVPEGRSWHTLTLLSPDKAILYGGFNTQCEVLKDCWELDMNSYEWTKMSWVDTEPRAWHAAAAISSGEVSLLGGISNNILDAESIKDHAEEFVTIRMTPPSLKKLAIETAVKSNSTYRENWKYLPKILRDLLDIRISENRYISR